MSVISDTIYHDNDSVNLPSIPPLTGMITITTRRTRPTSAIRMTPDSKRHKPMLEEEEEAIRRLVAYPAKVPVPSKSTIVNLYKIARHDEEVGDQAYLEPAGLLSLDQVLLPALALQEEKAVKKLQAKVQRDAPEYKVAVEHCRKLIRHGVAQAIQAVEEARLHRCQRQQRLRQEQAKERRLEREARARASEEERQHKAQLRQRRKEQEQKERTRTLTRQLPRNQKLWKEVVSLTSAITQLEKEERMWIEAEQELIQAGDTSADDQQKTETNSVQSVQAPKAALQEATEESIQDIVLASTRIQQGLGVVLNILEESEQVRKEMYQKYRKDHQFHGYQGVRNPRGLIRFLSQEN